MPTKISLEITDPVLLLPTGIITLGTWRQLPERIENLMTTVNEVAATLVSVSNELAKARGEILGKIEELTAALANVPLPPDAEAALTELAAQAKALDDIVPEALLPEEPVTA